jgi:hypothetical protein
MKFTAYGHPNIRATHPTTLEFTKDSNLTVRGDCIVGVNATFGKELKRFLDKPKITITIEAAGKSETITATKNPTFSSNHELVIRTTSFTSERTFATHADKASKDLSRAFMKVIQNPNTKITISID